jgi:hypothetical protein
MRPWLLTSRSANMNQFFNLARFGRLLRKHTAEQLLTYALGAAVLTGGILVVLGFLAYIQGGLSHGQQGILFTLMLLAAGSFFTSLVLAQFGAGSRAALALTLPASHFEKYLVAWLFSLPVFLAVFVGAFYFADWLVLSLSREPDTLLNIWTANDTAGTLAFFLVLHGLALWGSIFFARQQFMKTAFGVALLAVVVAVANFQLVKALLGQAVQAAFPFGTVSLQNDAPLTLPASQEQWLMLLPLALAALLWLAAYARLTEKQL